MKINVEIDVEQIEVGHTILDLMAALRQPLDAQKVAATTDVPSVPLKQAIEEAHAETNSAAAQAVRSNAGFATTPTAPLKLELVKDKPKSAYPSVEDAVAAATNLAKSGPAGMVKIRDLLAAAGAARVGEIPAEKRQAFINNAHAASGTPETEAK